MLSVKCLLFVIALVIAEIHGSKVPDRDDSDIDFASENELQLSDEQGPEKRAEDLKDGDIDFASAEELSSEKGHEKRAEEEEFNCNFETDLCGMKPALGSSVSWERGKIADLKPRKSEGGQAYLYASGENGEGTATISLPKYYGDENGKACVTFSTKEIRPDGVKKSTNIKLGSKYSVPSTTLGWKIWSGEVKDGEKKSIRISVKVKGKGHVVAVDNIKVGKCTSKRGVD